MLGFIKQTTILQNYPNPFNPETWFPYDLAEAAEVTLKIYDVRGGLVRQLRYWVAGTGQLSESRKSRVLGWERTNMARRSQAASISTRFPLAISNAPAEW